MPITRIVRAVSPVFTLLLGVAILLTGQGLQGILIPVRANLEEFSTLSIGLMGGAYYVGFTLGCLRGSYLVQRVGHIRAFAAMTAVASAAPILHGLWVEIWLWTVLRCISGYCFAVLFVVIESWLNEQSTNKTRGAIFSTYTLITLTVMAGGQQLLLLSDPGQIDLFAIASAVVSIAAIPVVLSLAPSPSHAETKVKLNLRHIFSISSAGALGCLVAGLTNGAFWSLAPVFVADYTPDVAMAAWFMTATVLGGAAGQWPLGLWSDHVDRRWVLVFASMIGMMVGLLTWWSFQTMQAWSLLLLGAIWGAAAFPVYAISVAQTNDHADADEHVAVSSALLLMYGVGAVIGPFLAPMIMTLAGGGSLFLFTSFIHFVFLLYVLIRIPRRTASPEEDHLPFTDSLTSAQTASQVFEEKL